MKRARNFFIFVIIGIIIMVTLQQFIDSMAIIMGITYILMFGMFLGSSIYRRSKRLALLNDACDPEAFLQKTLKQQELTGSHKKSDVILKLDQSAAYLCMDKPDEARKLLLEIEQKYIKNPSLKMVYVVNLIIAYYELGEIEQAERLYEQEVGLLLPTGKKMQKSMQLLTAERYYYLKKYQACIDYYEELLSQKDFVKGLRNRHHAGIAYIMALSNLHLGHTDTAHEQLQQVITKGNKLAMVQDAKQRLAEI